MLQSTSGSICSFSISHFTFLSPLCCPTSLVLWVDWRMQFIKITLQAALMSLETQERQFFCLILVPGLRAYSLQLMLFFQGNTWIWESAVCLLSVVGRFLGEHTDTYLYNQHLSLTLSKVLLKGKKNLIVFEFYYQNIYSGQNKRQHKVFLSRSFVKKRLNNYRAIKEKILEREHFAPCMAECCISSSFSPWPGTLGCSGLCLPCKEPMGSFCMDDPGHCKLAL